MATPPLSPTLWRTCRVLSGRVRLDLLRRVILRPGLNVSELAKEAGVGISDASQELRRIQSRGLIRRTSRGPAIVYTPVSDPLVPSAAPLLRVLKYLWPTERSDDPHIERIAKGLASERRVALVRILSKQPASMEELSGRLRTAPSNLTRHLAILRQTGWLFREGRSYRLKPPTHPLQAALLDML